MFYTYVRRFFGEKGQAQYVTQTAQSQTKNDENRFLELRFPKFVHNRCASWVHILLVRTWENEALIYF